MIPANISDLSIAFFAKGRPYNVSIDNPHFAEIRTLLLGPDPDPDQIIQLADVRVALRAAGLLIEGDEILFNGVPLHSVWVDKIFEFRALNLPFDPVFRALKDLMTNPTPAAIERLPTFVQRSGLGFLADGRIAAYKAVRDNYHDVHTGTVSYQIGSTVSMPREACNADPNQTCVAGLHLGALDYIRGHGYGWGHNRRLLLCAFWPHDVVAVPTDYAGGKMRVCQLEVLEEVDRDFVDQHFGFNRTLVGLDPTSIGQASHTDDTPSIYHQAKIGDWIKIGEGSLLAPGKYQVTGIEEGCLTRLKVRTLGVQSYGVYNKSVLEIVPPPSFCETVKIGDRIRLSESNLGALDSEIVTVVFTDTNYNSDFCLYCEDEYGTQDWVFNPIVLEIVTSR